MTFFCVFFFSGLEPRNIINDTPDTWMTRIQTNYEKVPSDFQIM